MGEVSITTPHCDSKYSEMHTKSRSMSAIIISSGHHKLFLMHIRISRIINTWIIKLKFVPNMYCSYAVH